jgi:hypothetical protein
MADEPTPLQNEQVRQVALTIADVLWPTGAAPNTSADRAKCAVATALRQGFPINDAPHMPAPASSKAAMFSFKPLMGEVWYLNGLPYMWVGDEFEGGTDPKIAREIKPPQCGEGGDDGR